MMALVTTPQAANLVDVKQTVLRLFRWLRANGHTDAKVAEEYVRAVVGQDPAHPPKSIPAILSDALVQAFATHRRTKSSSGRRAVSALRMAQTHSKSLAAALSQLDRDLAVRGGGHSEPPLGDLGNQVIAALARVQDGLESFGAQGRYPTTFAAWQRFTGKVCAALVRAGMPWDEAASFFPEVGVDSGITKERLRKRAQRRSVGTTSGSNASSGSKKRTGR
jgi:hypothetical protein